MTVWIGLDGGGTKTSCVLGDETGHILAVVTGPSTNIQGNDQAVVLRVMNDLISTVLEISARSLTDVQTIQMCLAGVDRKEDRAFLLNLLSTTPYYEKVMLTNDAEAALAAGTWGQSGLLLIAGTGSILYYVGDTSDEHFRIGGWGYLFGDEGSGYSIGQHAIQAVLQAYDGRLISTSLTQKLLTHYEMNDVLELIQLYRQHPIVTHVASSSRYVIEAAEEGDEIANRLVHQAIEELLRLLDAATVRMNTKDEPLVLHGGLFANEFFKAQFIARLAKKGMSFQFITASMPAVIGAYILAMKNNHVEINETVKHKVIATYAEVAKGE